MERSEVSQAKVGAEKSFEILRRPRATQDDYVGA